MNGEFVGVWRLPNRREPEFIYEKSWLNSPHFRPLSLSLPAGDVTPVIRGEHVNAFFDNLLPDSDVIRKRMQQKFGATSREAFDLLTAAGRDCAGAVQILPPSEIPADIAAIEAQPLDEAAVERILERTVVPPEGIGRADEYDLRISVAGAQEKTALLWHQGRWCRPMGVTPTTHLFKLPLGLVGNSRADMRTSVENEWLCAQILRAYNIPVASCEISRFGQQKCLIVERFDRRLHPSGEYWLRLPQEDFCQATGTPPQRKYEADGGPGMLAICQILAQSRKRDLDLSTYLKTQILFWMLRATDGHAKNFSIFMLPGGSYQLTPIYDVLSAWPVIGNGANQIPPKKIRMAQAWLGKNRHYLAESLQRRHIDVTALKCGVGANADAEIESLISNTPRVIQEMSTKLPAGFPQDVAEKILHGLERSANLLGQPGQP
jgi:serine/threonine-protein kinase HipA